ncbi:Crp/Fnr family transcriptional regulator [Flammeovirgaceae bacterium 311]|nr:Crp/Fnr family transcriptional regulator [Flammeovirgaceae bacterium 311]
MFDTLKDYCRQTIPFTDKELELIEAYFEPKTLEKKELLLENGNSCNFIAFIVEGAIRHYHIKDGAEKTCDISLENTWVTDFQSFTNGSPCVLNLETVNKTTVLTIRRQNLSHLYQVCPKYETFGRIMAERVAQRATKIAMSLSSDRPEERFQKLIREQPGLLQRVPQKYLASLIGVSPESLSRIRRRILQKSKS